ncbi:hypothetical protein EK21DRAFT_114189 [Setomelanomma holmii]|uniref:Uncharacterized protein n=1 Tax=Setomelanomma holmii TaxID=210430 RepID=A0A9P4H6J1_9PLEO|nr:hypothetical protein EK21DRAFT_114189 [Setomelanomma holmii]
MPSSPPQHIPLNEALESHGHDGVLPPMTPPTAVHTGASLSLADCRTSKKILEDVRALSPTASSAASERDESLLSFTVDETTSSAPEGEYVGNCAKLQYEHGEETEEGYEDEDNSMELSDEAEEDAEIDDYSEERDIVRGDGNTIEDALARDQALGGFNIHDQATSEEPRDFIARRATIEYVVEAERLEQERHNAATASFENDFVCQVAVDDESLDDAVDLSDDPDFRAVEAVQAELGMSMSSERRDDSAGLEYFDGFDRRASRQFSPLPVSRCASEDPPPSSSFPIFPSEPTVVPSPGGTHLEFTCSATIPDTPFAKTLKYFKHYKGKENSPSKSRRNASLPEEIAELLARDAEEDEDLEKYREVDLAPMEPVMESATAGDLITLGTPPKSRDPSLPGLESTMLLGPCPMPRESGEENLVEQVASLSGPSIKPMSQSTLHPSLVEQNEDDDADAEASDAVSAANQRQAIDRPKHPTFVTIVELLPKAMFWVAAAPIARLGNKAYDTIVEKFTSLHLEQHS